MGEAKHHAEIRGVRAAPSRGTVEQKIPLGRLSQTDRTGCSIALIERDPGNGVLEGLCVDGHHLFADAAIEIHDDRCSQIHREHLVMTADDDQHMSVRERTRVKFLQFTLLQPYLVVTYESSRADDSQGEVGLREADQPCQCGILGITRKNPMTAFLVADQASRKQQYVFGLELHCAELCCLDQHTRAPFSAVA